MHKLLLFALFAASCNESFNAGASKPEGLLPVDGRNPVILLNDSAYENWMGEYAMLLANSGGPELVGIVVTTGSTNPDIDENDRGWQKMIEAARSSGLQNIPDTRKSSADKLLPPPSGNIMETDISANRSGGAQLIRDESERLSRPYRPLVVVAGSRLTDVAIAYLMDPSVAERIWVVASVGKMNSTGTGANISVPNGEMDPWASIIVATKLRYIQVSDRYDSQNEVPDGQAPNLPNNDFGKWMASKLQKIWKGNPDASDQVSIEAVGIPAFVTEAEPVSLDTTADAGSGGPPLQGDTNGKAILVSKINADAAINRFWQMLRDPTIFRASRDASADSK